MYLIYMAFASGTSINGLSALNHLICLVLFYGLCFPFCCGFFSLLTTDQKPKSCGRFYRY